MRGASSYQSNFTRSEKPLNKSGVREIQQAFLPGIRRSWCLSPEYAQATAEVRAREAERDRRTREFML